MQQVCVIGPLLQEFGHAVASNGVIRGQAKPYRKCIIGDLPEREWLYHGMANTTFIPHDIRVSCDGSGPYRRYTKQIQAAIRLWRLRHCPKNAAVWMPRLHHYQRGGGREHKVRLCAPGLIRSGNLAVVHARHRTDLGRHHNWPREQWEELVGWLREWGMRVVCIGSQLSSTYVPGADTDMRGAPLEVVCNLLGQATVCVGESSGVQHLAAACECAVATWNGDAKKWTSMKARYLCAWNPFGAPAWLVPRPTWRPSVEEVTQVLAVALSELRRPA